MKSAFEDPKPDAKITQAEKLLDDEICRVANVMARLWASDEETAAALNIPLSDFNELRISHPELAEAIKSGKEMTNSAWSGLSPSVYLATSTRKMKSFAPARETLFARQFASELCLMPRRKKSGRVERKRDQVGWDSTAPQLLCR